VFFYFHLYCTIVVCDLFIKETLYTTMFILRWIHQSLVDTGDKSHNLYECNQPRSPPLRLKNAKLEYKEQVI